MKTVAVYGSLRKGLSNHNYFLKDAKYLGKFTTEPVYSLYSLGGYPGLKNNGNTSVVMEVYEVNEQEARAIDGLEGYSPNRKSTFYDKEYIDTPYGKAGVYIYVNNISKYKLVESGDWKEFIQQTIESRYSY
jgi:gamma-glutamylcyclotransferase (GGCT)/AIG2-like uncharacterized protein YtfP